MQKKHKRWVSVKCENPNCGKLFKQYKGEYNRSLKLGRKHYCCLSCYGKADGYKAFKNVDSKTRKKNEENIKNYCGNLRDLLTPFRYFIKTMRNKDRSSLWHNDIDAAYLREMWKKQKGICPYTGLKMQLPVSTRGFKGGRRNINSASIDRIDSSVGYIKSNIQFVCCAFNYAKNDFSHDEMVIFCKAIAKKWA